MKLEKAIEILNTIYDDIDLGFLDDDLYALKLGIEAMRRVKGLRLYDVGPVQVLLPGETKEVSRNQAPARSHGKAVLDKTIRGLTMRL